jgi:hypothetical protein
MKMAHEGRSDPDGDRRSSERIEKEKTRPS